MVHPNIGKSIRVAEILSRSKIVLNVGSNQGVNLNDEFIVYGCGDKEIIDPETNISLGKLEIFRGIGCVTSVQDTMCIIQAAPTVQSRLQLTAYGRADAFFSGAVVGDYAKPNATKVQSSKKN